MKDTNFGQKTQVASTLRRSVKMPLVRAAGAVILGALVSIMPNLSLADGSLKLDAACSALTTGDVTTVENPSCEAVSAIYIDKDGKTIYFERLELDSERLVSGRLVRVIRGCQQGASDCPGGCGQPKCFVCLGGRCGCVC
jgi:hypothetical protein